MSETDANDKKIEGEFEANLEDGEIDTDDDNQMKLTIDISKIDPSDLKELALVKTHLLNLTEELDKSSMGVSCSDDKNRQESNDEIFKSSNSRHKIKKRRKSRKHSNSYSEKSSKLIELDLYEDIDEYELLGARGGSPSPQGTLSLAKNLSKSYNISDESSYDSDYEYRSHKMRKNNDRKNYNKRRSDKDKNWNGLCVSELRGQYNNDDGKRSRDGNAHRKLEICKFYLSENCSKSDKCSYMHSDFPCKYYYLGMDCIYKPICKFSHGKPLSKNYRQMLLKHIKLAPKEILGKFERISSDKAYELLMKQHNKLCKEHKIDDDKNAYESEGNLNRIEADPIPSLLDMIIKAPKTSVKIASTADIDSNSDNITKNNNNVSLVENDNLVDDDNTLSTGNNAYINGRQRRSRWTQSKLNNQALEVQKKIKEFVNQQEAKLQPNSPLLPLTTKSSKFILNLKLLTNILSMKQIDKLESLGVKNLEHLSQLSLSQLNSMGLTATQINAVQLNTINMEKIGMLQSTTATTIVTSPSKIEEDEDDLEDEESELFIDESMDVAADSDKETNDIINNEDTSNFDNESNAELVNSTIQLCPPTIPVFDDSMKFINKKVIDISSTVSNMLMEINLENAKNIKSPSHNTPEVALKRKHSPSPIKSPKTKNSLYKRTSIYDGKPNEDYENSKIVKKRADTDMRIIEFIDLTRGEGDVDLRLPFNPMVQTLIPATEINGLLTNSSMKYQVDEIFVPESEYREIRRSVKVDEYTRDPRLRRIFCLKDLEPEENQTVESLTPNSPENKMESNNNFGNCSQETNFTPGSDLENNYESNSVPVPLVDRTANTDLIEYLQKSQWYKDLNSKDKVMVNQQMALISSELKKFHQDLTISKVFDTSFIMQNELMQKILIYLEIYIDAEGQIKSISQTETNLAATNTNCCFYSEQPVKSVGLLPTPIMDVGLLPTPIMEFSNNQLNPINYQNNFNYLQNQNFGNMNNSEGFSSQNNNNFQSNGRMFNLHQSQRYQRNSYCPQNFNANNKNSSTNNVSSNRRNNFNRNNSQYNNGGNKRRNKFNNQYTRGHNKI